MVFLLNSHEGYFQIKIQDIKILEYKNTDKTGLYDVIDEYIKSDHKDLTINITHEEELSVDYLLFLARFNMPKFMQDKRNITYLLSKITYANIKNNKSVLDSLEINLSLQTDENFTRAHTRYKKMLDLLLYSHTKPIFTSKPDRFIKYIPPVLSIYTKSSMDDSYIKLPDLIKSSKNDSYIKLPDPSIYTFKDDPYRIRLENNTK